MSTNTPSTPPPPLPRPTPAAHLRAIVEELVRGGVHDVVVCPGSRSTPLALGLRLEPSIRVWMHLDERAGAFFALGAAKASRRPTAILVTSGTAAANLLPALVEATHTGVPLIALTADRPPELRDRGAPQAIDQNHLFGRFAKWYSELPVPQDATVLEGHVRSVVARAVTVAMTSPPGPVHLNLPFREPLVPQGSLVPQGPLVTGEGGQHGPPGSPMVVSGRRAVVEPDLDMLARRLADAPRGVIVCGPLDVPDFAEAVTDLAVVAGYPILADPLANVRMGPHDRDTVIARHNALLRSATFVDAHAPDLVLRFGGTPPKVLVEALRRWQAPQIVVDEGAWNEPTALPVTMVEAEPRDLAVALAARLGSLERDGDSGWLTAWQTADEAADSALRGWLDGLTESFEGAIFDVLASVLPDGALLFAGNGMPVWDLDGYLPAGPTALRCLGNRGASGIDGLVSTVLGISAMEPGPVVAVIGDISFLHDLGALSSARRHELSATIVLVNNNGGGIFSFLPQALTDDPGVGLPEHYEELFGTPHGTDFAAIVRALGARHRLVGIDELGDAVRAATVRSGVDVLELRSDRARNVALHRQATEAVERAVAARQRRRDSET